ncbi:carbohydrate ABC transporter substrate-binding protein [Paenibacillus sambharensis]|uniref:Carbohydrate ABC transporter substrate-binding protein n=1 Tax=Paenibacillus sambharensis TaxID=1803190 RepID=A0A2W1L2S8_9BACL|nr:ABC transporter substrate-binding protein [Paenibacillus sambharensis]PZD94298.1 carbohydrate ABC transporter substrate-binding protein [Paenibacillus sambharensis]
MKKWTTTLLSLILVAVLAAGCGGGNNSTTGTGGTDTGSSTGTDTEKAKDPVKIRMFQFKVEIAEALERLKAEYEKENPNVKIVIETVGGGADYGAALKAKFASGDEPDIFNNGGYQEMETWMEHLEDMSDQPWVADVVDAAKPPMTKDGKIYGMPMNLEGYGFIYNKELFAKAGITETPKTLSELKAAAQKLQDAGITPFANGYQEWWILGIHNFNVAVAQQEDPTAFVNAMNDGTGQIPGNPIFNDWANLLDTTLEYSNKNPLTTDYNTQVTLFASGEAAMMQQGNWTQVQIDGINPDLDLGVLPMPINDDAEKNDKLYVGVPNNWVVNKNSAVKEEAKAFLNWMVTSDLGKKYVVDEFKFIPAFKSIEVTNPDTLGDIANDIIAYSKDGKTLTWNWFRYPEGVTQELGSTIQAYIAKKLTREEMLEAFQNSWNNLRSK